MSVDQGRADLLSGPLAPQDFAVLSIREDLHRGRRVRVVVIERLRAVHRCPRCREPAEALFEEDLPRRFRDCSVGDIETYLEILPWRVRCCGGTHVERFQWQADRHRMTKRFWSRVAALASRLSIAAVASLTRVSWDVVFKIDLEAIELGLRGRRPSLDGLRKIAIDEVAWTSGWRFFTIVTDLELGRVVWIGDGHKEEVLDQFFRELGARAGRLEVIVSDLWKAFVNAIGRHAPHAVHVLDRFHIVRWATFAVDLVRRRTFGEARKNGLKTTRWALLRGRERLSSRERLSLKKLARSNRLLFRAYLLKEQLREILRHRWKRSSILSRRLSDWAREAARSRVREFKRIARLIETHKPKILAGYSSDVKLGLAEAINSQIGALRRQACGYKDPEYYRLKIFQRCYLGADYVEAAF